MSKILVTRDSVCAGDDIDAPHEHSLSFDADTRISNILGTILEMPYLASISGGCATWSVHGPGPIAVIAQQWVRAELLPDFKDNALRAGDLKALHFRYHMQQDPWFVYEHFKLKRPTDAWGRFNDKR